MLGLSFAEIIVIIIVALVFLSPKDWIVFIRYLYKLKNSIMSMFNDATSDVRKVIKDIEIDELNKSELSKEHPLDAIKRLDSTSLPVRGVDYRLFRAGSKSIITKKNRSKFKKASLAKPHRKLKK